MRRWAQLAPRARLDALLDAPNAKALIRSLPAHDLYFTVQDVGLADATDVLALTSPAQFQTFLDLGGWKGDRLDPHQVLTWLRAAQGEDQEEYLEKLLGMDMEVLEHTLRERVVVHSLEEDPDANPEGVTMETPEGKY